MAIVQTHIYGGFPPPHYGQKYEHRPPPPPSPYGRPLCSPKYGPPQDQARPLGPTYSPPSNKPRLPTSWLPLWDQAYQRWYYANTTTGRTQWEAPGFEKREKREARPKPAKPGHVGVPGHDNDSGYRTDGPAGGYEPAYYDQYGDGAYGSGPGNGLTAAAGVDNSGEYYDGSDRASLEVAPEPYEPEPYEDPEPEPEPYQAVYESAYEAPYEADDEPAFDYFDF